MKTDYQRRIEQDERVYFDLVQLQKLRKIDPAATGWLSEFSPPYQPEDDLPSQ